MQADLSLLVQELELAFTEKALESRAFDPMWHTIEPLVVYLRILRLRMGRDITLLELQQAVRASSSMHLTRLNQSSTIDGVTSTQGIEFELFRVLGKARSKEFHQHHLRSFGSRVRPQVASSKTSHLHLTAEWQPVVLENVGYGAKDDLQIQHLVKPEWVEVELHGLTAHLRAKRLPGGAYTSKVEFHTSGGQVTVGVSFHSALYPVPEQSQVYLDELLPEHPDLDRQASRMQLGTLLQGLGFQAVPGGLYHREEGSGQLAFTRQWVLTEEMLQTFTLPALGYRGTVELVDSDSNVFRVQCQEGMLGGSDLKMMLELHEAAEPYMKLSVTPHLGQLRVKFHGVEEWRGLTGESYLLTARCVDLQDEEVLGHLLRLSESGVKVDVFLSGPGSVPVKLVQQHRSGRLTLHEVMQMQPYRLYVTRQGRTHYCDLPTGRKTEVLAPPRQLQEAQPYERVDYRDRAWRGGEGGMLELSLSVHMEQVKRTLTARKPEDVDDSEEIPGVFWRDRRWNFESRLQQKLRIGLMKHADQAGVGHLPKLAAPILDALELLPEQVVLYDGPIKLTETGHLIVHPSRKSDAEQMRYVARAYGGILHHSQLRKLLESYLSRTQPLDAKWCMDHSRDWLGWAGPGYRRPPERWEPEKANLRDVMKDLLDRYGGEVGQAEAWARAHLNVPPEKLQQSLSESRLTWTPPVVEEKPVRPPPSTGPSAPQEPGAPAPPGGSAPVSPVAALVRFKGKLQPEVIVGKGAPDPLSKDRREVQGHLLRLLEQEGPMTRKHLMQRYASCCGRTERLVKERLEEVIVKALEWGFLEVEVQGGSPEGDFQVLKRPHQAYLVRERKVRAPEHVPLLELLECAQTLKRQHPGVALPGVLSEVRRLYGLDAWWKKNPEVPLRLEQLLSGKSPVVHG